MSDAIVKTFGPDVYADRIKRAQALVHERGLSGLIIGTGSEFAYFTGSWMQSHERLTALVIPAEDAPWVVVPLTDAESLAADGVSIRGWRDGDDSYALATQGLRPGTVGFGSSLTANHVFRLQQLVDDSVLAVEVLAELFMVKDAAELEQLDFAGRAIDRVHDVVPELLQPGRTERAVAQDLERLILKEHDAVDFVIVGSGPNGANPHHDFSDRVLEEGDSVVVDIGGTVGVGYHSDCTRTYQVGEITDPEFLAAYDAVRLAQEAACQAVKPGVSAADLDAVARGIITQAGFGDLFTHRLGHGIGLAGHEEPFIIQGNDQTLQECMTFSIEPGVYKPGAWGIRIEDIVAVTSKSVRYFNFQPKDLR
ncbi:Xaa-Pro peptidase family protein [Corynebacterium breve]|uniref:Xaa-Pro peptidase family protein n=1 Tax=Corynebacterium breve TaxID=3049799 RepID=A0ABY8VGP2_9CORY|nr:Xaa-Pro peptidase family protein [Corynebacterium breve]WIM68831.1 Xaa-Pro peptidase family protein [Corynebacterium breve]